LTFRLNCAIINTVKSPLKTKDQMVAEYVLYTDITHIPQPSHKNRLERASPSHTHPMKLNRQQKQILAILATLVLGLCIIFSPKGEMPAPNTAITAPTTPEVSPQEMVNAIVNALKSNNPGTAKFDGYENGRVEGVTQTSVTLPDLTKYYLFLSNWKDEGFERLTIDDENKKKSFQDEKIVGKVVLAKSYADGESSSYNHDDREQFKKEDHTLWQMQYVEVLKKLHTAICQP